MIKTVIIRHRRENLKKCSLRGLEKKEDLVFYSYPQDRFPDLRGFLLLKVGAPPLTQRDADQGILLIDGTWRLAQVIERQLPFSLETRSLPPHFKTAYPRRQTGCTDPETGLSSVEALYLAHQILGRPSATLLDFYPWKQKFLDLNELSQ